LASALAGAAGLRTPVRLAGLGLDGLRLVGEFASAAMRRRAGTRPRWRTLCAGPTGRPGARSIKPRSGGSAWSKSWATRFPADTRPGRRPGRPRSARGRGLGSPRDERASGRRSGQAVSSLSALWAQHPAEGCLARDGALPKMYGTRTHPREAAQLAAVHVRALPRGRAARLRVTNRVSLTQYERLALTAASNG
jgi:hypothetical protein